MPDTFVYVTGGFNTSESGATVLKWCSQLSLQLPPGVESSPPTVIVMQHTLTYRKNASQEGEGKQSDHEETVEEEEEEEEKEENIEEDEELDVQAKLIEQESARIRLEMEHERKFKMGVKTLDDLQEELQMLENCILKARKEKQTLTQELLVAQESLKKNQTDIKHTEKLLKQNRSRAEDIRTEVMLAEFKRDTARKELYLVNEELERKRQDLENFEGQDTDSEEHIRMSQETAQQVTDLIRQNEEYQQKVNRLESEKATLMSQVQSASSIEREREELVRQLDLTKEELFSEQKQTRHNLEGLEEELEAKQHALEEMLSERDMWSNKFQNLEMRYKQMERDKNTLIQEKTVEYEELQARLEKSVEETRNLSNQENTALKDQLQQVTEELVAAQSDFNNHQQELHKLRDQVLQLQNHLALEREQAQAAHSEAQLNADNLLREKEDALSSLQQAMEADKIRELTALQEKAALTQQELTDQVNDIRDAMETHIATFTAQLTAKDAEIDVLRDRVREQDGASREMGHVLKQETIDQVRSAIEVERSHWQSKLEAEVEMKMISTRAEYERTIRQLREELATERDLSEKQLQQIAKIRQELEEARQHGRGLYTERLAALTQMKQLQQRLQEKEQQNDAIQTKLQRETQSQLDKLRRTVQQQDEEISHLKTEKDARKSCDSDRLTSYQRQERMIIDELNEESHKTSQVLGVSPRTIVQSPLSSWSVSHSSKDNHGESKAAITSALASMRACNAELRQHVTELKLDVSKLQRKFAQAEQTKSEEMGALKSQLQEEKLQALESLKDRLIKEHVSEVDKLHKSVGQGNAFHKALRDKDNELQEIQRNMNKWKEETSQKLCRKFQEELAHEIDKRTKKHEHQLREWEREKLGLKREISRIHQEQIKSPSTQGPPGAPVGYSSPVRAVHNLQMAAPYQSKPHQFSPVNTTNLTRTGRFSSSTPDLSHILRSPLSTTLPTSKGSSDSPTSTSAMEQRVHQAENRAHHLEQRADNSDRLLNQKLLEVTKLHGVLSHQSKELMQLERAYSQLQQNQAMPRPWSSLR